MANISKIDLKAGNPSRYDVEEAGNDLSAVTDRMRKAQWYIVIGFGVAIIGIVIYCVGAFSAGLEQTAPAFIVESLSVIGAGTFLWFVGAIKYLNAAIDSNAPGGGAF